MARTIPKLIRPVLAVAAAIRSVPCALASEVFQDTQYGYEIAVPDGWQPIPTEILQQAHHILIANPKKSDAQWIAGFQQTISSQWFEYPYSLITVVNYRDCGLNRQITEAEFPAFVAALTGANAKSFIEERGTSTGRDLLQAIDVSTPTLDTPSRQYVQPLRMELQGIGRIRGV